MIQTGVAGGAAMGGAIQKLPVGRHATFDQVIRGACDSDYVDAAPTTTRGAGGYEKPAPGCVALNAASYRHYRRFFEKIVAASAAASRRIGRGSICSRGEICTTKMFYYKMSKCKMSNVNNI